MIFGGRDNLDRAFNDLWILRREPNISGDDYLYRWLRPNLCGGCSDPAPSVRSQHTAVGAPDERLSNARFAMLVYGGRNDAGNAFDDKVYRFDDIGGARWQLVFIQGDTLPANRFGHAAFFDDITAHGRMLVFGGIGADGETPTDLAAWELRFTSSGLDTATWGTMTEVAADSGGLNRKPSPRFDHAMAWDGAWHWNSRAEKWGHVGFLFGGQLGIAAYSDTLWLMWLFADSTYGWEPKFLGGPRPGARARHTLVLDDKQGGQKINTTLHNGGARLYLSGGDAGGVAADDSVYVLDPWDSSTNPPRWSKWAGRGRTLSRAPATLEWFETLARTPEVYSPAASPAGQWQPPLTASPLLQPSYPPTFVISGGPVTGSRVLATADNDSSYWLDVATSGPGTAWTRQGKLGFRPESGVLYRPNNIMLAGGTGGSGSSAAVGTTKTLDAGNLGNTWQSSGSMAPRALTNLVLLPNGKVLAVGGMDTKDTDLKDPARAVTRPQIWDPATGAWTDTTVLERQPTMRNYHSTAILLPDGRVLSGGGDWQDERYLFNVFCPPYLFKTNSDVPATRPVITTAPGAMTWGSPGTYTLCVADTTGVRAASLLRPGATTHFFDQNQRFVPLSLTVAGNPSRLLVTAPANGADAPPGNYMLFATGSPDHPEVPSIARWLAVGSGPSTDPCDVVAPATVADLSAAPCPGGSDNQYLLQWTAPADDGSLAASRRASSYDIRQYGAPITDANWALAEPIGGPTPGDPGSTESMTVTVTGTTYLRMKSRDDRDGQGNWSGLSNQRVLHAIACGEGGMFAGGGGGGGGGSAIRPGPGASSAQASTTSSVTAAENSLLNGVPAGTRARDFLRLGALDVASDGTCAARVRVSRDRAVSLDAAQLLAVDHPAHLSPYALGGTIVLGTRQGAARVTGPDGSDLTVKLSGGDAYPIAPGDTLTVDLGPGGGASPLVIAASGRGALECVVPDRDGGWRAAHVSHPRTALDELALPAPGSDVIRLVAPGGASLEFVGRLVVAEETPGVEPATLVSSSGARAGDVTPLVSDADTAATTLAGPDTLALVFAVTPPARDLARDYFLVVDATPLVSSAAAPAMLRHQDAPLPTRFALRPNRPNPFSRATSIRFELPVGGLVRLEVFDAQGRRVATLANGYYPPGFHAVTWTPAAGAGTLGPGVYFCRMQAGTFRARNRMVLLP